MPFIDTMVTMDSAGRIALPKSVRDELGLRPGSELELRRDGTGIHLRLLSQDCPLREVNGFLVYAGRSAEGSEDPVEA
ncbi:MAG: AbrB/MazE/SpoVT family DNA-binding domain-containing protein [Steroidobacteraceae bacterium]